MTPPPLSDNEGVDFARWLCSVPGIPADWGIAVPAHAFVLRIEPVPVSPLRASSANAGDA
jgi:hypothetical protein